MSTRNRGYWNFDDIDQPIYFPEGVVNKVKYREGFSQGYAEAKLFISSIDDFCDQSADFIIGYYDGREECQQKRRKRPVSINSFIQDKNEFYRADGNTSRIEYYCNNICWQDIKWFDETDDNYDLVNVHYIKDDKRVIGSNCQEILVRDGGDINIMADIIINSKPNKDDNSVAINNQIDYGVSIGMTGLAHDTKNRNRVAQLMYELEKFNVQLNNINILKEDLSEAITYKGFKNAIQVLVIIEQLYKKQPDVLTDRNKKKLFDIMQTLLSVSYEQKDDNAIDKLETIYANIFSEFFQSWNSIVSPNIYGEVKRPRKFDEQKDVVVIEQEPSDVTETEKDEPDFITTENPVEEREITLVEEPLLTESVEDLTDEEKIKEIYLEKLMEMIIDEIGEMIVKTVRERLDNLMMEEKVQRLLIKDGVGLENLRKARIDDEILDEELLEDNSKDGKNEKLLKRLRKWVLNQKK